MDLANLSKEELQDLLANVGKQLQGHDTESKTIAPDRPAQASCMVGDTFGKKIFPACFNGSNIRVCIKKIVHPEIQLVDNADDGTCHARPQHSALCVIPALPEPGTVSAKWKKGSPIKHHLMMDLYMTIEEWPADLNELEDLPIVQDIQGRCGVTFKPIRGHIRMVKHGQKRQLEAGNLTNKVFSGRPPSTYNLSTSTKAKTILIVSAFERAVVRVKKSGNSTKKWTLEHSTDGANWTPFEVAHNKTRRTDDPAFKLTKTDKQEKVRLVATEKNFDIQLVLS